MINATFRPLDKWPGKPTPSYNRKKPFRSTFGSTMDVLEKELLHLAAKNIVIQIETDLSEIRNDGWPRSNAKVRGPKVAISFDSIHGLLTYYCDACHQWIDNVRAIAMTLERLRLADLYGVTKRGEQYQGFKALPGGIQVGPASMSLEQAAAEVVRRGGGDPARVVSDPEHYRQCYRRAVMACHPDRYPDLAESFQELQHAADLLKKHHNIV